MESHILLWQNFEKIPPPQKKQNKLINKRRMYCFKLATGRDLRL